MVLPILIKPVMRPPIEIACLRWIAAGKSSEDIARIEGIEPPEVDALVQRAIIGLEAKSVADALDRFFACVPEPTAKTHIDNGLRPPIE